MTLTNSIEINENIITATISATSLGNTTIDADDEKNQLHNFTRTIEYSNINFANNMKLSSGVPIVTSDTVDVDGVEEVAITNLINKKINLDENFKAELVIDINKIPSAEYEDKTVFNSAELLGQAYAVLFIEKVKTAVSEKLAEIRALANDIEKETEVVL